jgi:hypothetical protein
MRRKKFSIGQTVFCRYSDKKFVGQVAALHVSNKQLYYTVNGEDGKIYDDMQVDTEMNYCIDTYLTRLFYSKYGIDASVAVVDDNSIPVIVDIVNTDIEEEEELGELIYNEEEVLFDEEDDNLNW